MPVDRMKEHDRSLLTLSIGIKHQRRHLQHKPTRHKAITLTPHPPGLLHRSKRPLLLAHPIPHRPKLPLLHTLFFFIPIFQCTPRRKIWDQETPGRCLNVIGLYYTSAVFNTVSDIAMLSVPIYLVWNLQMSIRRKVGISVIFCTGGL